MKSRLFCLLLGSLVAAVPFAYTQQQPERIYIDNITLQIGMDKDAVISKLAEHSYKLEKVQTSDGSSEGWIVSQKNGRTGEYDVVSTLEFKDGRLWWALKQWAESWDAGSAKVGKNLYFLVKSLENSGNTTCTIETRLKESPEFDSKETLMHCGRRTVAIGVSRYKEQHEETQVTETVK